MKNSIIMAVFFFASVSCTKKDDCKETLLSIKHFESEYGCENTKHTLLIDTVNACVVIRSKESYDELVSGICHPEINFSLYDLIIGKQSTGNWNDTILYDYRKTCPENNLTLTIEIVQSDLTLPDNVVYHALIPKLGDEETLYLNINVR